MENEELEEKETPAGEEEEVADAAEDQEDAEVEPAE